MERVNNLTPRGLVYNIGRDDNMYPLPTLPPEDITRWHSGPSYTTSMKLEDYLGQIYIGRQKLKNPVVFMNEKGRELFHELMQEQFKNNLI